MALLPGRASHLSARLLAACLAVAAAAPALAQQAPTPPAAAPAAPADPVLATVNGQPIHLSELNAAAEPLPPQARQMPPQQLYPMLLAQMIDSKALQIE